MIVLITGAPASGKTTLGQILATTYNYVQLDGDQLIKDLGLKSENWNQIHSQLRLKASELHQQKNVVISHVVLPETITSYYDYYEALTIPFKAILLKPQINTLLERSAVRTSHPKPTPENFIHYFHEKFTEGFVEKKYGALYLDNSVQNLEETMQYINTYINKV